MTRLPRRLLLHSIGELVTCEPLAKERRFTAIREADLGRIQGAWLALEEGRVQAYGSGKIPAHYRTWPELNAEGALVTPGLVDCHTHPLFAGDRTAEFAARLNGKSYQEIAAAGGGIKSTIAATRRASDAELERSTRQRLARFLEWGVTSVEAKSGYGQSVDEELRHLRILKRLAEEGPQTISVTCLALHDMPLELSSKAEFIRSMQEELLPRVAAEQLAGWVDAFVEEGYFSVQETRPLIERAKALGFSIRLHADEFAPSGAAEAAAAWGAASADHLQQASDAGIEAMARAGTVAVLLPGTSLYTRLPYTQAKRFRERGCPIAVGSDYNPGSCFLPNLPLAASLAALYAGLSLPETFAAVSWNAARALRLEERKGALALGYDADLVIHSCQTLEQWVADLGQTKPKKVLLGGTPWERGGIQ